MEIVFKQVNFAYQGIGVGNRSVLHDVNLSIPEKQITALIGKTGSGKTTLTQLCNGILTANSGQVRVGNINVSQTTSEDELFQIKQQVGMVFQFPETQLFEKTVLEDVMFGALNFGYSKEQARDMAVSALKRVGIDDFYFNQSPLSLSGGQMRRVAIAGVLAYAPKILVFDEPTAGLDTSSKQEFMSLCRALRQEGMTIIIVSHDMDEVAEITDNIAVMMDGTVVDFGTSEEVFYRDEFDSYGLDRPQVVKLYRALNEKYNVCTMKKPVTFAELMSGLQALKKGETNE